LTNLFRAAFLTLLAASTLLLPSASFGGPSGGPEEKSFQGQLEKGGSKTFTLPTLSKGFWQVILQGPDEGVDLDLRLEAGEAKMGSSRGDKAYEELVVPATKKGLQAVVDHYDGEPARFTLRCVPILPAKKLALGKTAETGNVSAEGVRYAIHELPATPTKFCTVSLSAARAPEGTDIDIHVYDDDWKELVKSTGDACDEQVILSPSRDARWVMVRCWQGQATYSLEATPLGEDGTRLALDQSTKGELPGGGEEYFRLRTTSAGIVTVRLEGPKDKDFDLQVWGPDGYYRQSVANDAEEEIAINGAKRGDYLVRVYGCEDKDGGEFTVETERLDISKLASSGGRGQVWGLFVGIANYEEVNNLTYTTGDALAVYQAMRAQGNVDRRHSIVLLDEQARRADVVAAIEAIVERADEDDTFVFFYSGHGGNDAGDGQRGDPKDEADGSDEYIVCQDSTSGGVTGDLVDDDLRALLDRMKCQKQLIFFDACFCGGFAELIDKEGRYACLSSLETQTSTEALKLKQGLLTAILIDAFQGKADANEDGRVTLGEVSAYVERVQPNTCPGCQAELTPQMRRCRECGADLEGDNQRQIPVIVSRTDNEFVLSEPGRRSRRAAR
jgi:hypothetical protein